MNSLKLKAARVAAGLGQQEISKELGMSIKSYNEKENQKKNIWLSEVIAISKVLNLDSSQVVDIFFTD